MPGICVIADRARRAEIAPGLAGMLGRMKHFDWYRVESHVDPQAGVALGRVALGMVNRDPQPACSSDGLLRVVLEGEIYDSTRCRRELERGGCRFASASDAEILLHGYRQTGRRFVAGLDGKFVAAIWDASAGRLVVVGDRFGMRPLYWTKSEDRLIVASEIKSLLAAGSPRCAVDRAGLAQFFSFGQYLGDTTSLDSVRLLPAAAWLEYDPREDRLTLEQYADPAGSAETPRFQADAQWLDAIEDATVRAVERRTAGTAGLGLSLSGGLDARTILGATDSESNRVTTVTLGMAGCRDHRWATALARLAHCRHYNYVLSTEFLADYEHHLRRMVYLTDGQYLSQSIVMPTLPFYRDVGIRVLLRGHGGELMHMNKAYNFSLAADALAIRDDDALKAWAFRHLRAYMLEAVDRPLLAGGGEAWWEDAARSALDTAIDRLPAGEPGVPKVWPLFLTQRIRRETALSLMKFGSLVETRLPYLDRELVALLLAAPVRLKMGETLQGHILARHRPEFLRVINVNTGTRIGAPEWLRRAAGLRQRILAKLRFPGYQPYERLGLWLRRELRPLVERILLDERCLGRGIFVPDTLRRVVTQHFAARRNHTYLILAMLVFELSQRMLADGEPLVSDDL